MPPSSRPPLRERLWADLWALDSQASTAGNRALAVELSRQAHRTLEAQVDRAVCAGAGHHLAASIDEGWLRF